MAYGFASISLFIILAYFIASIYIEQNKYKLLVEARKSIEKKYHSVVEIKNIHLSLIEQFPNLSIQLDHIDVKGPMYGAHHQKLFTAKKVSLRIKPLPLLIGSIVFSKTKINNGQLFIYTDSLGKHNLDELKQKRKAENKSTFPMPENIELNEFNIIIKDDQKLKNFQFNIKKLQVLTNKTGEITELTIKKEMTVRSLTFNHLKGSFLKNQILKGKYTLQLNNKIQTLSVNNISLIIGSIPFNIQGIFDLKKDGQFKLNISTKSIPFDIAQLFLTKNINRVLKFITITKPLSIDATITGPLNGGEPHVIANWETKQTIIGTNQIQFTKADVKGSFNNQVKKEQTPSDSNSTILLTKLTGDWHSIPIKTTNIQLNNLTNPNLKGGFSSQFDLTKLNLPLNTENIIIKKGLGIININYEGPLNNILESNTKITGRLQIVNGEIYIKPIQKDIINTQAEINLNNNTVEIKNLTARTKDGSNINVTGVSTNSLSAIPNTPGKANIVLNIKSPYLDLNNFSTTLQHNFKKGKKPIKTTFSKIDHLLENETIHINLEAKSIKWQKLTTTNLKSSISLKTGIWELSSLSMNMGKGNIQLSSKIIYDKGVKTLFAKYNIIGVKADELLYGMGNFNLPGISYKNIRGILFIKGQLIGPINQQGGFNPNKIKAHLNFQLNQGALLNYPPLIKIQEHIFKKRKLDSLQFSNIQNEITIQNGNIHIPRMEIATSALNLFVGGDYGLNGKTNLHIQIPLNNITKRDQSKKMLNVSNKEKGGTSIFLSAISDETGHIKLKIDPNGARYKKEQIAQ
ncbi:AsmA-like C-terminal region-containing protein [Sediminibacterium sp.]|uniref:AsmA-like C-terminal region-containing protein n=1 Tax=Sediminibacterium sp. TaxID=1917865 RepID=UPI002734976F|nr:AsmA-like C-terminal region-containing protein [Sediminibacterium sp.]MDP3568460.1 AsmA-like C-terminal region-containing protein [Sediminibacterium sp.]